MKLHHYTTIENLALILNSKKIRFSRLTTVDDTEESENFGEYNIAPFIFVSCWTTNNVESIPLWKMYTGNMRGVRISFDGKPFHMRKLEINSSLPITIEGEVESPLTIEQIFNPECFVLPEFITNADFGGEVEYTDDLAGIYQDAVKITRNDDGSVNMSISGASSIAKHKSKVWAFQEEYRFNLMAFPAPKEGYTKDTFNNFHNLYVNAVYFGSSPRNNYIDVDLCPEKLNNMTITLGPLATISEKIIVNSLIQEYCPGAKVVDSSLKNKIRK
ncbi:DUF2971 domain-containing protein [Shewanella hafniensis]|uniref:DUF2971 domain-containing protein n=2 Tax=Shewanella hafniensis TaxID=365590 RepID=UPI00200E0E1F|nr:DUF2971 domain-containing protein [Shewanella hafniensis]MCL1135306.1 DUF2971 domain-containing protein [Shewanella hafniensis]